MSASKEPEKPARVRTDGRKTLLVYLDGGLIKNLKKAALDDERNVYEIVEEAARDWLSNRNAAAVARKPSGRKRSADRGPGK
jgi:hypothetical protein